MAFSPFERRFCMPANHVVALTTLCIAALAVTPKADLNVDQVAPGFNPTDATQCVKNAIATGDKKLTFRKMSGPWIVGEQIDFTVDGQTVVFDSGVEVAAKQGAFVNPGHCMFRILADSVTLSGYGASVRMRKADYLDRSKYEYSEWRHAVATRGAKGLVIEGLHILQSGGDGIYVAPGLSGGATQPGTYSSGVIRDVVSDDNYRQGISVISAKGLLIENSVFMNTDGTPPEDGIDIEPNSEDDFVEDIVVRNCKFLNNSGNDIGIALYAFYGPLDKDVSITFEECETDGAAQCAVLISKTGSGGAHNGPRGFVTFADCIFRHSQWEGFNKFGDDHENTTWTTTFRNCVMVNCARAGGAYLPIGFGSYPEAAVDGTVANIDFDSLWVIDDKQREVAGKLVSTNTSVNIAAEGLENVDGVVVVENPNGVTHGLGSNWVDSDLRIVAGTVDTCAILPWLCQGTTVKRPPAAGPRRAADRLLAVSQTGGGSCRVSMDFPGGYELRLLNLRGRTIAGYRGVGPASYALPTGGRPAGVYIVVARFDNGRTERRAVKAAAR